jgi:glutamate racemase
MGGLTVLAALRRVLPDENFLYLGDTARLPYGTKSPATVRRYAAQAAQQLVDRGVKALVVACNTASAFSLDHLSEKFAPLPVFGVIEPGAQAASACAKGDGVLVVATESTIAGGAYQRALTRRAGRLPVYGRACPLWVTLAEQGPQDPQFVTQVLRYALRGFVEQGPSTLLLGCTHFPVFHTLLQKLLPPTTQIVDSAATTAEVVGQRMLSLGLLNTNGHSELSYFATDGVARFVQVGGYFLGAPISHVELVDL